MRSRFMRSMPTSPPLAFQDQGHEEFREHPSEFCLPEFTVSEAYCSIWGSATQLADIGDEHDFPR